MVAMALGVSKHDQRCTFEKMQDLRTTWAVKSVKNVTFKKLFKSVAEVYPTFCF